MGEPKDLQHVKTCEANHKCVYASYASDSVQEILNTTGKCIDNDSYSKTAILIILPYKGYESYMYKHLNIFNVIGLLFKISISEICKGTCISGTCRNTGFKECNEYIENKATTKQPQRNRQRRRIQQSNDEL